MTYNVTLEKTVRVSFDIEADDPDEINERMPEGYADMFEEVGEEACWINYDWSICDDDGNDIIPWS